MLIKLLKQDFCTQATRSRHSSSPVSASKARKYLSVEAPMKTTPDAVKSLLHRARVNLHAILIPYLDEGRTPQAEVRLAGTSA